MTVQAQAHVLVRPRPDLGQTLDGKHLCALPADVADARRGHDARRAGQFLERRELRRAAVREQLSQRTRPGLGIEDGPRRGARGGARGARARIPGGAGEHGAMGLPFAWCESRRAGVGAASRRDTMRRGLPAGAGETGTSVRRASTARNCASCALMTLSRGPLSKNAKDFPQHAHVVGSDLLGLLERFSDDLWCPPRAPRYLANA